MGRASRMKAESRAQRAPRTVSIYSPKTGLLEQHHVTISDRSLASWVRDREQLSARGYPDRPPIYDDPKVRYWSLEPGEAPERSDEEFATSWATWHPGLDCDLMMLACELPDGRFVVRFKVVSADGRVQAAETRFDTWPEVLAYAKDVMRVWASLGCEVPQVVTRQEVMNLLAKHEGHFDGAVSAA